MDPDFEGRDLIQILDWAEGALPWLAYRNGNLLLGAIGGSYGGLVMGLGQNDLTPRQQELLARSSLVSACSAGSLPPIACVRALGGDVRLLTKNSGHDSVLGGATGEQCGARRKVQAIVDWYDEKLRGIAGRAACIPRQCFHMDGSASDAVITADVPVGGPTFSPPPALVAAQDGSPQVASLLLTTVGPSGAVLAGIPTIRLTLADPLGLETGDPIVFLGLAHRAPGALGDTLLQANQVRPFRGWGTVDGELIGATARLAPGTQLRLLIHAAHLARYPGSGSDVAAPVVVTATVGLPLLPPDLPAPPAN